VSEFLGVKISLTPSVVLPLVVLAAAVLAYAINGVILWALRRAVQNTSTEIDDRIYGLLHRYLFPLLVVGTLLALIDFLPLPAKILQLTNHLLILLALLLAVFLLTQGALLFLRSLAKRYEAMRNINGPIEIVTKIIFVAVGGMIILDNLGISLTPLITTLGIGSLAIAIALQDTLGNFFAGLYIKADRPFKVGHYVRLESGEEGYVDRLGWRSTRIRMLPNNMVVVPNTKIVQSNITNYHLPEKELAVLVQIGVNCDSDLGKVERVTREVAKAVLETVPGGVPGFEPFIRYHTFNPSSIDFTVILRAQEFVDNFLIKHEFIKRLQARYQEEGITIPLPIHAVYLKPEPDGRWEKPNPVKES